MVSICFSKTCSKRSLGRMVARRVKKDNMPMNMKKKVAKTSVWVLINGLPNKISSLSVFLRRETNRGTQAMVVRKTMAKETSGLKTE